MGSPGVPASCGDQVGRHLPLGLRLCPQRPLPCPMVLCSLDFQHPTRPNPLGHRTERAASSFFSPLPVPRLFLLLPPALHLVLPSLWPLAQDLPFGFESVLSRGDLLLSTPLADPTGLGGPKLGAPHPVPTPKPVSSPGSYPAGCNPEETKSWGFLKATVLLASESGYIFKVHCLHLLQTDVGALSARGSLNLNTHVPRESAVAGSSLWRPWKGRNP